MFYSVTQQTIVFRIELTNVQQQVALDKMQLKPLNTAALTLIVNSCAIL